MAFLFQKWWLLAFTFFWTGKELAIKEPAVIPHPFYVSVTEVERNAADKTLEVSCKFFTDDFEHAIENAYKTQVDITAQKDKAHFDKYIPDYINKHLSFSLDGKGTKLNYVGYEIDKESVYCYFEVVNVSSVRQLDISNSLLHDFTKEQINIMHITLNGKRQSSKLNYPSTKSLG
jgi:hypothetical protein